MKRLRTHRDAERNKPPPPAPHPRSGTLPSMSLHSRHDVEHDSNGCESQGLLPSEGGQFAIPSSASQITMKSQITNQEVVYDVPRKHILDDIDTQSNPSYAAVSFLPTGTASPENGTLCSESVSIQQLVQKHSKSLPARTKVVRGYYGQNVELIADEYYDIHFIKRQKVVNIKDAQGTVYTVPLASSLQFSLVFNRDTQQEDNITFHKASDIMAQKFLPGVVCATKAFQGADEMSSVQENEVLKVQCVELHGKETLKVFSFTTQSEKVLQADCAGDFSTKPSLIRLHLSDIITCIPCRAVISIDEMATPPTIAKKLTSLLSGPIIITESKVETSLVASLSKKPAKPSQKGSGKVTLLDIPLADHLAEVEFAMLEPTSTQEAQLLHEDTRNIMREFDPSQLKHLREAKSARIARVQSLLYTEVQESQGMVGIELKCSIEYESPPPTSLKLNPRKSTLKQNDKLPQAEAKSPKVMEEVMYETLPGEPEHNEVHIRDPVTQPDIRSSAVLTKPKPAPAISKESVKRSSTSRGPPTLPRKSSLKREYEAIDDIYPPGKPNVPPGKPNVPPGKPNVPSGNPNVPLGNPSVPPGNRNVPPNVPPKGGGYSNSSPKPTPAVRKKPVVSVKPSISEDDSYVQLNRTEPIEARLNLLESLSKKHDQALQRLDDMQSTLERVTMKLLLLETQVQTLTLSSVSSPFEDSSSSKSTRQQNKQYLRSLNNTQIQRLLEAMDLVQYKEAITRECIDGEILCDLDEQSLESDLGIAVKLHRVRLVKVITGCHSAEQFLTQNTRS